MVRPERALGDQPGRVDYRHSLRQGQAGGSRVKLRLVDAGEGLQERPPPE